MKYYLAPMEGITGYVYRNVYHTFFRAADKYFTPFIAPNQKGKFSTREENDILPSHNEGMYVVPQILTNHADDFVRTAQKLSEYGYQEVNLNLGCPSRTVVAKYRGSGFLAKPDELDCFLEEIFHRLDLKISIKTRIGKFDEEEFRDLLCIYNRYPLEELIIHPRCQKEFYSNTPHWEVFEYAVSESKNPLCYNGDIFTAEDFERWRQRFPDTDTVMLGRGVLRNPGLIEMLEGKQMPERARLKQFHDRLFKAYQEAIPGERNVLFKMKELWVYLGQTFPGSEKCIKKIKKAQSFYAYAEAVETLFEQQEARGE